MSIFDRRWTQWWELIQFGNTNLVKKEIVDARADTEGDISHVRFKGNQRFTPVKQAIPMADRGEIERTHVVRRGNAKPHLRTNADGSQGNNLDEMAGDKK